MINQHNAYIVTKNGLMASPKNNKEITKILANMLGEIL